jgi:hypothetical protein
LSQRNNFRVVALVIIVEAFANNPTVLYDYCANGRIRVRDSDAILCKREGAAKKMFVRVASRRAS